jgi:hypothetical protein
MFPHLPDLEQEGIRTESGKNMSNTDRFLISAAKTTVGK